MFPPEVMKTIGKTDGSGSRARALFSSAPGNDRGRNRGTIYALAVASLLVCSAPAHAQKPLEIGVLALGPRNMPAWRCGPGTPSPAEARRETRPFYITGLMDELEKLKYVENRPENAGKAGRRYVLDLRMGTPAEVKGFAREFARKPVDVIVAVATTAVRVAQEETQDRPIPILFPGISDPVGDGFVQSLARPGGFITGVSHQQVQGSGKRVELFKEMFPGLRRLVTIRRPGYGPAEKSMVEIREAADRLKIEVLDWTAGSRDELRTMLAQLRPGTADGIMILPDSFVITNLDLILEVSLEQRVPTFGLQDFMADWGALGAYGPSAYQAGGRIARYVDKIAKGAKPGDLPVEPIDPTLVVNLKAAECLGVSVPLPLLHQADRVIR
jgi:putative tryptophan/tyrosine transport system substrate-binding protein